MDSRDNFREWFDALEQQTEHSNSQPQALEAQTRTAERRLRWWRGLAGGLFAWGLRSRRNDRRCQMPRSTHRLYGMLLMGMAVGWITSAAGQPIRCGDTLGPGGVFELQADLTCGEEVSPALTVRDGARLDLGGHTLRSNGLVGILLVGTGAVLENGTLNCSEGCIRVAGHGQHTVRGVNAEARGDIAITVVSADNQLISNSASTPEPFPITIQGKRNLLVNNRTSGEAGFLVTGDENLLFANVVLVADIIGIEVGGNKNLLIGNVVASPLDEGIVVSGEGNVIIGNIATAATRTDLVDTHEDCDENLWLQNVFRTSRAGATENPACIR